MTSTSTQGVDRLHSILHPGHCFGEAELLIESPRMTSAFATQDSVTWRCKRSALLDFLDASPVLLRQLLSDVVRRMQALDDMIEDLVTLGLKGPVAKALLSLAASEEGDPFPRRTVSLVAHPQGGGPLRTGPSLTRISRSCAVDHAKASRARCQTFKVVEPLHERATFMS